MSNNPENCWKLPLGQSAAEPEREGSTTSRKAYAQVGGSTGHPETDDDIVWSLGQPKAAKLYNWAKRNKSNDLV